MRRVVITGMGIVSPVGNDIESFWNSLSNGVCGIDFITRFDTADFKVKVAAEVKSFEPLRYMEKSDVRRSDLFTQYALYAAAQAMQDSGLKDIDPMRLGVYMGSGIGGIITFTEQTGKFIDAGPNKVSPFFIPMIISNISAGTISIKHNAMGPCLPVVTACATGTHAIGEAYRTIKFGYADAIIAGGSEAAITPLGLAGFSNMMALSTRNDPKSASIPFDKRRDGFVMGEGAGALILEEYEHARLRGANIYAEICGYSNTCDAYHITAPHPEAMGAAGAITQAMAEANMQYETKIYINTHGTSTQLNDKTETLAIKKALGDRAYTVNISSTKSMTGHMLGAAGAAESIAAVLSLKHGVIPPTIGYEEPDPECDLNYTPNTPVKADVRLALSLSLGFGGHNACVAFKHAENN